MTIELDYHCTRSANAGYAKTFSTPPARCLENRCPALKVQILPLRMQSSHSEVCRETGFGDCGTVPAERRCGAPHFRIRKRLVCLVHWQEGYYAPRRKYYARGTSKSRRVARACGASPSYGGRTQRERRSHGGRLAFGTSAGVLRSRIQACEGSP